MRGQSKYLYNYYHVVEYRKNRYKLTVFKTKVRNSGFELPFDNEKYKRNVHDKKLESSLSRSRKKVFEYAMCNEFDYFVTLTLNEKLYNRYDLKKYIKDLGQFIRDYRKKYKVDIQYLFIPEKHQDEAWHIHGLLKGLPRNHLEKNKNGYLDWFSYSERFGWISIDNVRNQDAVSKYIIKYITKGIEKGVIDKNKKTYYASRGLKKPKKIIEGTLLNDENISFDFENDYVKTLMFNKLDDLIIT